LPNGTGLRELPKNWGFPFNIYTMAEASDFKFGTQLGFAKATIKPHSEEKCASPLGYGSSQMFGVFV